jgi:hypothetical protein
VVEGGDDCLIKSFGKGEKMAERAAERGQLKAESTRHCSSWKGMMGAARMATVAACVAA